MTGYLCTPILLFYQRDTASLSRRSNSYPKSIYRFPCDIGRVPLALLPASRSLGGMLRAWGYGGLEVWRRRTAGV